MRNVKYSWQQIAKASFVGIATTATFYLTKTTGLFSSWFLTEDSTDFIPQEGAVIPRLDRGIEEHSTVLMDLAIKSRDDIEFASINTGQRRLLQSGVTVANPIPDQVIDATTSYQYDLSQVFTGNYTFLGATLANGSALPDWLNLEYLLMGSRNGGFMSDVVVQNQLAYVVGANAFQILNVSNPKNIISLSSYVTSGGTSNVQVENGLAYVADASWGLHIFNVSNPRNIISLGSYDTLGYAGGLQVQGSLVYVADGASGLGIFNVSKPSNITFLGGYDTLNYAYHVQVQGNLAYVANSDSGLLVLNVSNSNNITYVGNYNTPAYARDVQVQNGIAYVADDFSGLQVLNVSNPSNITRLGSLITLASALRVQVQFGIAYVAVAGSGLQVLNVKDPSNIISLGSCNTPGGGFAVQVLDGLAYVADWASGLQVIDLHQGQLLGTPTTARVGEHYEIRVSAYADNGITASSTDFQLVIDRLPSRVDTSLLDRSVMPGQTLSLTLDSDVLFTNPSGSTLVLNIQVFPLTTVMQLANAILQLGPVLLGNYDTPGNAINVQVQNGLAYVADAGSLQVLNVSNPEEIANLGTFMIGTVGTQIQNDLAYAVQGSLGLQILNVSNPRIITSLGSYNTPGGSQGIWVQNGLAYIADGGGSGLQILNVSNPRNITWLGSFNTTGGACSVQVQAGLAYVADVVSGLQVLNVSNPSNVTWVGSYDTPSLAYDVQVLNGIAYVADSAFSGLQILNVSNPKNITRLGSYQTNDARAVQVKNGLAYIADQGSGLLILNISNPKNITRLGSYDTPGYAYDVQVLNGIAYVADSLSGIQILDLTQWKWSVTPTVAEVGNYRITVIATDELGGSASASFQLRVEGPPRFNSTIPTQYAKVGQVFNYFIPQGLVSDPNNDPISFTAVLANNQSLPAWLSFSGISAAFVGTPQSSNVGNITILLSATDNIAGSVNTTFKLITSHLPVVNQPLSNTFARVNQFFQLSIPNNTFSHPDGLPLNYSAQLSSQAALPSWLRFNTSSLLLSGQPNSTDAGVYDLRIIATDIYLGQAAAPLTLSVGNGVQVNRLINSQLAAVSQRYTFAVPSDSFVNLDGTAFSLQPSALPSWLTFAATTAQFSGTPLASSRGTTLITLTATDFNGGTAIQAFNMTVTYFPQVVTPLSDQIAPIDRPYQFNVSNATFIDQNGYALTYRAEQANGQALPNWLNFNATALRFFGTPNITQALRYSVAVIATNPLGAEGRDEFSLFAEHYPTIQQPIPNAVAGVDIPSSITISGSSFNDLDNDPLNYTVTSINQSPLPNWLSFDARTLVLSGTPLAAQLGNISLLVTATDPSSGSAQQNFTLTVRYLPKLSQPVDSIPPVREEQLLNYTLPAGTFTITSGATLNYNALLDSGASLPAWLNFTAATQHFIGTPTVSDIGSLVVRVIAEDGQGGTASTTLTFVITPNYPPVLVKPVSNEVASVYQAFRLVIPPDTFSDANNDPLTYSASQVDGRSLPRWLHFDAKAITFSGTPDRGDTGDFSEKIIPIRLTARDDRNGANAQFNINVQGTSSLALFIQIAAPLATVFTAVYATYKKRALCFNRYKKERYQRLEVEAKVGEMFEYKLEHLNMLGKKIQMKTPRQLQGYSRLFVSPRDRVPGGGDMPSWMKYDVEANCLCSKGPVPDNSPPEFIVQIKDSAGVVHEQFTLRISGLKAQNTATVESSLEMGEISAGL